MTTTDLIYKQEDLISSHKRKLSATQAELDIYKAMPLSKRVESLQAELEDMKIHREDNRQWTLREQLRAEAAELERDELREEAVVRKDRILEQRKENQSLRAECERLKQELDRKDYVISCNKTSTLIDAYESELAALRRQIENCSDCTHDLKLAREALASIDKANTLVMGEVT